MKSVLMEFKFNLEQTDSGQISIYYNINKENRLGHSSVQHVVILTMVKVRLKESLNVISWDPERPQGGIEVCCVDSKGLDIPATVNNPELISQS